MILATVALTTGCAGPPAPEEPAPTPDARAPAAERAETPAGAPERPIAYPIEPPPYFEDAIERGTRTATGEPGPDYWQQWTDYRLAVRLATDARRIEGTGELVYHNRSPDTLGVVFLQLIQNLHAPGAIRFESTEVTDGIELERVAAAGRELSADAESGPRYVVDGTRLAVVLPRPLMPGGSVRLELDWGFTVPQAGIGERMGWSEDDLFFIAYWYPQMHVYDDVVGWQIDQFRGQAEFYAGFGSYEVEIEVPEGWVVTATGTLTNPEQVLSAEIRDRLRRAEASDEVVHVLGPEDLDDATLTSDDGRLTWRFHADSVRDFAFSATRRSRWDAARTPVGDRDGDGADDYARVDALWRESAPLWSEVWRYSQHSIDFLSRYTGLPYPWPHMTAVEGAGIIGGGMEFPMMTLMGDYNERGDSALYYVTAHELAHMWVPMMVSTDERRRSWMDEGTTSFNENQARMEFYPGRNHNLGDQQNYLTIALSGLEGEMMRWSDFHYVPPLFGVASYSKPATVLVALRGVLGEEMFNEAYRTYLRRWAFQHPYAWDMFNAFESVSGRELDWFWRSWYYETWTLDQAVAAVEQGANGGRIVIEDRGRIPMPVRLEVTREDGTTERHEVPVSVWLEGATRTSVPIEGGPSVVRVEIDPEFTFPDANRENNIWERAAADGR